MVPVTDKERAPSALLSSAFVDFGFQFHTSPAPAPVLAVTFADVFADAFATAFADGVAGGRPANAAADARAGALGVRSPAAPVAVMRPGADFSHVPGGRVSGRAGVWADDSDDAGPCGTDGVAAASCSCSRATSTALLPVMRLLS